jgi:hypothetical protein
VSILQQFLHYRCVYVAARMCLRSLCLAVAGCLGSWGLAMDVSSRATVLAFNHYVTILWRICLRHRWATDRWARCSSACAAQQYSGSVSFLSAHVRVKSCYTAHAQVTSYNSTASVYNSFLGDDYVVGDATIEEMSQAVFSASPLGALGGCISLPTKAVQSVVDGTRDVVTWTVEDLRVQLKRELELVQCGLEWQQ